ncbi:hypothetical protein ABZ479_04625 [Streptomyces sp. NPDC005722]
MRRARLAALTTGLAAGLALTACGVPPSGVIEAGEPASGMYSPVPQNAKPVLVSLYFLDNGKPRAYVRKATTPWDAEAAVRMLFGGPSPDEATQVTTELPRLKDGLQVKTGSDGVYVQLPKGLPPFSRRAMMQLACTVSGVGGPFTSSRSTDAAGGAVGGAGEPPSDARPDATVHVLGDGWTKTQTAGPSCPAPAGQ